MRRSLIILIIIFSFFELIFLFVPIRQGIFFFTFDQARDAIWVKNQIDGRQLSLLGPWASLQGTFFGPLWFWLLIIPHIILGGSPSGYVVFNALIVFGTVIFTSFILRKFSKTTSYFIIIIGLISIGFHGIAGFAFPSHMMLFFTLMLMFSLTKLIVGFQIKFFLISILSISLMFHGEPPTAIFSFPVFFLISTLSLLKYEKRNIKLIAKIIILGAIVFLIPFVPQIVFDLRHNFLQTRGIISYFQGKNQSLGDILPFSQRLINRPLIFFTMFQKVSFHKYFIMSFFSLVVIFLVHLKKEKNVFFKLFFKTSILYLLSLLIFFTIYPPQLKDFYLDGLLIIFLVLQANALSYFWKKNNKHQIAVIIYLCFSFFLNREPIREIQRIKVNYSDIRGAGSIYANQVNAIDWVYKNADGRSFKVYIYEPAVYDFAYQYIFMNYGLKRYGYLPEDFAYLPNQPEYIPRKSIFLSEHSNEIKNKSKIMFLIVEDDIYFGRQKAWLNNFSIKKFPINQKENLSDKTRIEERTLF